MNELASKNIDVKLPEKERIEDKVTITDKEIEEANNLCQRSKESPLAREDKERLDVLTQTRKKT